MLNNIVLPGTNNDLRSVLHESERLRNADLLSGDPFSELAPAWQETPPAEAGLQLKETPSSFLIHTALPNVKMGSLSVRVAGNLLTISGRRLVQRQPSSDYASYECTFEEFTGSLTLPDGADGTSVHAELKDGVLSLAVAKEALSRPRWMASRSERRTH